MPEKAHWMRKSAEGGFRRAMNEYGMMFEQGEGVPKDIAQAKAWFRKASASEGDAAYNLGAACRDTPRY